MTPDIGTGSVAEARQSERLRQGLLRAQAGPPVALDKEAYKDPRFKYLPELKDEGFQSFLSVPMLAKNEVIGVINVKTRAPHRYSPKQVRLLSAIAAQAAAAIEGARLQESMY